MFNLEKGLGEIEATASAVIGKTDNDEQLSDGDRLTLAAYMAFQHTRTPAYRGWLEAIQAGGRRAEELDALPKPAHAAAEKRGILEEMSRKAPRVADKFLGMNWKIMRCISESFSFVTTDSPVSVLMPPQPNRGVYAGAEFHSPGAVTVFPLSAKSALAMWGAGNQLFYEGLAQNEVRAVNLDVVSQYHCFVFARDMAVLEDLVTASGTDTPDWRPPLLNS